MHFNLAKSHLNWQSSQCACFSLYQLFALTSTPWCMLFLLIPFDSSMSMSFSLVFCSSLLLFCFRDWGKNCISRALLTTLNIIRIFRSEIHVTFWTREWARCSPLFFISWSSKIYVWVCVCARIIDDFVVSFSLLSSVRCLVSSLCHFLLTFLFYSLLSKIEEGGSRTESSLNWFYMWDSFISRRLSNKSYR